MANKPKSGSKTYWTINKKATEALKLLLLVAQLVQVLTEIVS